MRRGALNVDRERMINEAANRGGVCIWMRSGLLELRRYARKGAVELATESIDDGDNGDGNASGNKAILDRRCSRLVVAEPNKKSSHL
jgi:hypothetical protein